MKRYSSAPCLEDVGGDFKRTKGIGEYADPNTKEYLQLALNRVLELQREIKDGTYVAETNNDNDDLDISDNEEDLTKEILVKVFEDLPGTSSSIAKIVDRETRCRNRMAEIQSSRIQLLGFDTCRRMALEFMKTIMRESRNRSSSLNTAKFNDLSFQQNELWYSREGILASDLRKRESSMQEIRTRMLRSLDLHLAVKQRDYTAKLMRSDI